jgi:hypothetical protein
VCICSEPALYISWGYFIEAIIFIGRANKRWRKTRGGIASAADADKGASYIKKEGKQAFVLTELNPWKMQLKRQI